MCQLCSGEESERITERARMLSLANRLRALAKDTEALAYGEIPPHGGTSKSIGESARHVIRDLVGEWL